MPARLRRPWLLSLVVAAGLIVSMTAPAGAVSTYSRDLFFSAGYERQIDSRTCTAASTAMMMNFIARRDLNLASVDPRVRAAAGCALERGPARIGSARLVEARRRITRAGRAARRPTNGRRTAAPQRPSSGRTQIAVTGKPVGLLVRTASHAMVMTGFTASANPAHRRLVHACTRSGSAIRTARAPLVRGPGTPLQPYLQTDASAWYDLAWYGRYVVIVPQG